MAGARANRGSTVYTRNEVALRHGAGVARETTSDAYVNMPKWQPGPPDPMPF